MTARVDDDTSSDCVFRAGHIGVPELGVDSAAVYQHGRGPQPQLLAVPVSRLSILSESCSRKAEAASSSSGFPPSAHGSVWAE